MRAVRYRAAAVAGAAGQLIMAAKILSENAAELRELGQLIGEANVTKLCQVMGGTRTYVPRAIGPKHPISIAIGPKAAAIVAEYWHGRMLDLPKAHLRRQRALDLALSGEMTIREAALYTDYTERWIYELLARHREQDGQLSLFDEL